MTDLEPQLEPIEPLPPVVEDAPLEETPKPISTPKKKKAKKKAKKEVDLGPLVEDAADETPPPPPPKKDTFSVFISHDVIDYRTVIEGDRISYFHDLSINSKKHTIELDKQIEVPQYIYELLGYYIQETEKKRKQNGFTG